MIAHRALPADKRPITRSALLLKHIHQVSFECFNGKHDDDDYGDFSMKKNSIDIYIIKTR